MRILLLDNVKKIEIIKKNYGLSTKLSFIFRLILLNLNISKI